MNSNTPDKLNNLIEVLNDMGPVKGSTVISNFDTYLHKVQTESNIHSVSFHLDEAKKHHFEGNEYLEKDSLFQVYCEIKDNSISDEDLRIANLMDYATGNTLSIARIEGQLEELGWKG